MKPAPDSRAAEPVKQPHPLLRPLFVGTWYFAAPAALALLAVRVLRAPPELVPSDLYGYLRGFVRDQEVPSGIVLFTVFEWALYSIRHHLPLALALPVAGRHGLPRELRDEFEAAAALVEELERLLRERAAKIERDLPRADRDELSTALEELRAAMTAEPLDAEAFRRARDRATRASVLVERWRKSELREYVESIGLAVLVAVLLRAVVVEAFKIPSGSMLPTLQIGDHIFVNKFVYGPMLPLTEKRLLPRLPTGRGDVIVFENPDRPAHAPAEDYIKRVIGLPGDRIEARDGHPVINGWRVPSCVVGRYVFAEQPGGPETAGDLHVEYLGERAYLTFYEEGHEAFGPLGPETRREGPFTVKAGQVFVFGDNRNNSRDSRAWYGGLGGGVPYDAIKGRAMFVWLPTDRFLVNVMGSPQLPKGAPAAMVDGIALCLARRPPLDATVPPPPPGG